MTGQEEIQSPFEMTCQMCPRAVFLPDWSQTNPLSSFLGKAQMLGEQQQSRLLLFFFLAVLSYFSFFCETSVDPNYLDVHQIYRKCLLNQVP